MKTTSQHVKEILGLLLAGLVLQGISYYHRIQLQEHPFPTLSHPMVAGTKIWAECENSVDNLCNEKMAELSKEKGLVYSLQNSD